MQGHLNTINYKVCVFIENGSNFHILKSFAVRDTLNPKVWENPDDPKKATLKPKVKEALTKIANDFEETLGEGVKVDDVVLTGSLSNYNWSEYSDFDLHLIIDYKNLGNKWCFIKICLT